MESRRKGNRFSTLAERILVVPERFHHFFELQHAIFMRGTTVGMTPEQAVDVEARRKLITAIVDRIVELKRNE